MKDWTVFLADGSVVLPLLILVVVVLFLCVFNLPHRVAKSRNHPSADAIFVCQCVGLLIWPAWLAALVWAYSAHGSAQASVGDDPWSKRFKNDPRVRGAFPLEPEPIPVEVDGPGRYRVVGVVKATGTDVKTYIDAESRANAAVKAELKGIAVTELVKE